LRIERRQPLPQETEQMLATVDRGERRRGVTDEHLFGRPAKRPPTDFFAADPIPGRLASGFPEDGPLLGIEGDDAGNTWVAAAKATASAAVPSSTFVCRKDHASTRVSHAFSRLTSGLSPCCRSFMRGSSQDDSAGVTVIETSIEARTDTM